MLAARCTPLVGRRLLSTGGRLRPVVHEVALRDGLQNEKTVLSTDQKLRVLEQLVAAEPASVEIASFVRKDRVPAMADADELCERLWDQQWALDARERGMPFVGLVMNARGFERFARANLDSATVLVSCSEGFSKANSGKSIGESLRETCSLIELGRREGYTIRAYASMAFGCPMDGEIETGRVVEVVTAMGEAGAEIVLLGDTSGMGHPHQVAELGAAALEVLPPERLGLHMHDTYGRSVANCDEALRLGLQHYDSSAGGCGGCPFAPGASGNMATADLLQLLEHHGLEHGMHAPALRAAQRHIEEGLGKSLKPWPDDFEEGRRASAAG